jgi:heme-degrading monooxygenase HmoA
MEGRTNSVQIHVAIYQWKDGTDPEQVRASLAKVKAVRDRVPGLLGIFVGENTSKYSEGYTHAIVVVGEDQAALDAYRKDSLHEEAAHELDAIEQVGVGVDFADGF